MYIGRVIFVYLRSKSISMHINRVAYYRISRDDGKSRSQGLGLEAQQTIISHFCGGNIVKEFTEIKSAKNIYERPILQEAIRYCLDNKCTLVVAKVDRLSRNVDDCRQILDTLGGNLLSGDIPGTIDLFTLTLFAAFAERERMLISIRTSQALQAKKAREGKWHAGNPALTNGDYRKASKDAIQAKAATNENNIRAKVVISLKRAEGMSYQAIADYLNAQQFRTAQNKEFNPVQVQRLCVPSDCNSTKTV